MKGILIKDWYMITNYCKTYVLIAVAFFAMSFFSDNINLVFITYPCIMCGMIPITIYSHDEKCNWCRYSSVLPYSAAEIVSSKYLYGIFCPVIMSVFSALVMVVNMNMKGGFQADLFVSLIGVAIALPLLFTTIMMPLTIKLGMEKARLVYYAFMIVLCGGTFAITSANDTAAETQINFPLIAGIMLIAAIAAYVISWALSVQIYKKQNF